MICSTNWDEYIIICNIGRLFYCKLCNRYRKVISFLVCVFWRSSYSSNIWSVKTFVMNVRIAFSTTPFLQHVVTTFPTGFFFDHLWLYTLLSKLFSFLWSFSFFICLTQLLVSTFSYLRVHILTETLFNSF